MAAFPRRPPRLPGFDYKAERTYFVTFCTRHQVKTFADPMAAQEACRVILRHRAAGKYFLYAYCVMPDHIHLLLKTRRSAGSLSTIVATIKASIRHNLGSHTLLWADGFYERVKRHHEDTACNVAYILENPIRAGLVQHPEEYTYVGQPDSRI